MSEKQTKNTNEILSNVWNWEHTEDGGRRAISNQHPVIKKEKMLQEIQDKIGDKTLSRGCKLSYNNRGVLGYYETYYTILHCHNKKVGYMLENDMGKCLSYYDCNIKYFPKELVEDTSHIYKKDIAGFKVIGHPISLSRVLSAFGHGYWYDFSNQMIMFMKDSFIDGIYWYLLKEDKSDAYLDDQSDETIKAIREIISKCDHVGDGVAYMTNPAQYKCNKCGEMFK